MMKSTVDVASAAAAAAADDDDDDTECRKHWLHRQPRGYSSSLRHTSLSQTDA